MAITLSAATELIWTLKLEDFRGQTLTKRYTLLGTRTDAQLITLLTDYIATTNCAVLHSTIELVREFDGVVTTAANALERNISEQMELAFVGEDLITSKPVTKTVIIPALVAAIELMDGSPDPANAALNALIADLHASLCFTQADGSISTGLMVYNAAESHHITVADVVDTI